MNLDQINVALSEKYQAPCRDGAKRHIIFWYDAEGDFQEVVGELELAEVKLWKLTETNKFITKYTLEVLDPDSHYLIYAAFAKPEDPDNWLLDIVLYSHTFIADKIALMMDDLHVENSSLRPFFKNYEKFFQSKEHVYTVGRGDSGMIGVYKIETEVVNGAGKFERSGLGNCREAKENTLTAFNYFKANSKSISGAISTKTKDYLMYVQDIQGIGMTPDLTLTAFIAMCSGAIGKPPQSQLVVLGSMSLGGTINKVEELANTLQVSFDAGAKGYYFLWLRLRILPPFPRNSLPNFKCRFIKAQKMRCLRPWGWSKGNYFVYIYN